MIEVAPRPADEPAPVIDFLLAELAASDVSTTQVITRAEKIDLRRHLAAKARARNTIETRLTRPTQSVAQTLLSALPTLSDSDIALAFPDIVFRPAGAFDDLLSRWAQGSADVLLGALPTDRAGKSDLVEVGANGRLKYIRVKDPTRGSGWSWIMAVWNPRFSGFLCDWVAERSDTIRELQIGHAMNDALSAGLCIAVHRFEHGRFLDIGTPEDLARLQREGL